MIFNVKNSSESVMAERVKYGDSNVAQELSKLSDTVSSSVRMEIQSYTGTGLYGEANPCTLTFSFAPKVIVFVGATVYNNDNTKQWYSMERLAADKTTLTISVDKVLTDILTTSYKMNKGFYTNNAYLTVATKKSEDGKTITWYNTANADYQLNNNLFTYYFMALG